MVELATVIPLAVVGVLAVAVVLFIIKSLIKMAVIGGVLAALVFAAYRFGAFDGFFWIIRSV